MIRLGYWFLPFACVLLCRFRFWSTVPFERGRVSGASCLLVGQINSPQPCFVSRDRCCDGERKSRTRYHTSIILNRRACLLTSCLIVCPSTIFEIPLPSSAIAKMPPKSKSSKPQKTLEEKVEAAMADARAAGLPEGWTVKFNVSN